MAIEEKQAYEIAADALKRNTIFFEEIHKKKLEEIQKVEDKIDEILDEQRRRDKVEKLQDKVLRMREDLEVFEGLFAFTKTAKEKIEKIG